MANSGSLSAAPDLADIKGTGFDPATDSLVKLRDELTIMEGATFSSVTDTLEEIRDKETEIYTFSVLHNFIGDNIESIPMAAGVIAPLVLGSKGTIAIVASDVLQDSDDTEVTTIINTYTKKKDITVPYTGTYRVKFDLKDGFSGDTVMGKIYKDGVAHGVEQTHNTDTYATKSEDLDFTAGEKLQLYISDAVAARGCFAENLRIYGEINYGFVHNM